MSCFLAVVGRGLWTSCEHELNDEVDGGGAGRSGWSGPEAGQQLLAALWTLPPSLLSNFVGALIRSLAAH